MFIICCIFAHTYIQSYIKIMDKSFRQRVIDMNLGDKIIIAISQVGYTTIRSYAYEIGFAYQRKYTTHRDVNDRTYTIERVA